METSARYLCLFVWFRIKMCALIPTFKRFSISLINWLLIYQYPYWKTKTLKLHGSELRSLSRIERKLKTKRIFFKVHLIKFTPTWSFCLVSSGEIYINRDVQHGDSNSLLKLHKPSGSSEDFEHPCKWLSDVFLPKFSTLIGIYYNRFSVCYEAVFFFSQWF